MSKKINVHEAKTHFSKLLRKVAGGDEIIIAKSGTPVARLVPVEKQMKLRFPGSAKEKVVVYKDFDAPLPAADLKEFEQ